MENDTNYKYERLEPISQNLDDFVINDFMIKKNNLCILRLTSGYI